MGNPRLLKKKPLMVTNLKKSKPVLVVGLLSLGFCLGIIFTKILLDQSLPVLHKSCELSKLSKVKDVNRGHITVIFKESSDAARIRQLIESHNLQVEKELQQADPINNTVQVNAFSVKVPSGQEAKWTCELEKNSLIKHADLQVLYTAQ